LDGIALDVQPGEFVCVLGPSGCGKSTLLSLIGGLDRATRGVISIGGERVVRPYTDAGVVFQRDLLLEWRTCLENVLLQYEMRGQRGRDHEDRARELLRFVGVEEFADRYPRQLSGGMRQRVAICRALAHDPGLLLMDEPFGALDALTRDQLNGDLAEICSASQKTVIFVTHSISEAVFLGDRVVVMSPRPGRVVADVRIDIGRPRTLADRDSAPFVGHMRTLRQILAGEGVL
jgi:NitT/TauT family transport system ATP-binding protein